ncbi:glucans biosynthesis glucosyltransferase MdoH [Marivibrio halodurans]|uniref:Glucans biosynthesis glucosyltransferase H n=2 Tax=Marivibrio halodurans TaxID=2039722 RepID=A0A8J7V077_9PROT|nr:glucans biosynthesis glucosyltransferase MdoH [Marivibrio halodurans]
MMDVDQGTRAVDRGMDAPLTAFERGDRVAEAWRPYRWRRLLVLFLNLVTIGALIALMSAILGSGGWSVGEIVMLACFAMTLPWLSIGLWNALIGFAIHVLARDPAAYVTPALANASDSDPITYRSAIAMTVRNEDPSYAVARLRVVQEDLDAAGLGDRFDFHVLSDTTDAAIGAAEEAAVDAWRQAIGDPDASGGRIHYRRRTSNEGFKAGNVWEFVQRCGDRYDLFLPFDADSLMSARALARMVRVMQANPRIGILQGLVVGMPSPSFFSRTFQFGMRHGMRTYTAGSAWWQGDCGPFWGHNAAIRIRPFRDHCDLPTIPGRHVLSGDILSHDQVEAVLMRRAGYEVRVIAEEDESWEENPHSLPDFIKRDLRWCQGNMQYLWLMRLPGVAAMSRLQLALAILMYAGAPGWMAFLTIGAAHAFFPEVGGFPLDLGLALFVTVLVMSLMPKLMGMLDVMVSRRQRRRYGGTARVALGSVTEIVTSALLAPAVSFAQARFIIGLLLGRKMGWGAQRREGQALGWGEATRGLWPQTLFGLALGAVLAVKVPAVLPWASPLLASFVLAIPFAVLTASPWLGRLSRRVGLCDIPEDRAPNPALRALTAKLEAR